MTIRICVGIGFAIMLPLAILAVGFDVAKAYVEFIIKLTNDK